MKKLSKLMALLLSLLIILSLFAACGDDKENKTTEMPSHEGTSAEKDNPTGENLLIGVWGTDYITQTNFSPIVMQYTFEKDGTWHSTIAKEVYDIMIEQTSENLMSNTNLDPDTLYEKIAEMGYNIEELDIRDILEILATKSYGDYDSWVSEYQFTGTWTLDGDTLTIETDDGGISTAETKLSKGKTTFTLVDEDGGAELDFTKIN